MRGQAAYNFLFATILSVFFPIQWVASYSRFGFWNHSVLVFDTLMTNEVRHLFIHLFIIWISSFYVVSIHVFYPFALLVVFFLLICKSCLYVLYVSPLSVICIANVLSHSMTYLFILLMVFWWKETPDFNVSTFPSWLVFLFPVYERFAVCKGEALIREGREGMSSGGDRADFRHNELDFVLHLRCSVSTLI